MTNQTKLLQLRIRLGLSQAALAKRLGLSTRTISSMESGGTSIKQQTILAVERLLMMKEEV